MTDTHGCEIRPRSVQYYRVLPVLWDAYERLTDEKVRYSLKEDTQMY